LIREDWAQFPIIDSLQHLCIPPSYKVIQHFRRFRFVWDFPTGAVFGIFEPLEVDCSTLNTQKAAHPYAKPRLLSHHMSKSVANCGL
jgi:hypothetical protein